MVFADHAADSVVLLGVEGIEVEVDDFRRQRLVLCRAGECHVRPVGVVVGFVVAQDSA